MLRANPHNLCKVFFYKFLRSMFNYCLMFLRSMFILGVFLFEGNVHINSNSMLSYVFYLKSNKTPLALRVMWRNGLLYLVV